MVSAMLVFVKYDKRAQQINNKYPIKDIVYAEQIESKDCILGSIDECEYWQIVTHIPLKKRGWQVQVAFVVGENEDISIFSSTSENENGEKLEKYTKDGNAYYVQARKYDEKGMLLEAGNNYVSAGVQYIKVFRDNQVIRKKKLITIPSAISPEEYLQMVNDLVEIHQGFVHDWNNEQSISERWYHKYDKIENQIERLEKALLQISKNPEVDLRQEYVKTPFRKVKHMTTKTMQEYGLKGNAKVKAIRYIPSKDIYEHRMIRSYLEKLRRALDVYGQIENKQYEDRINRLEEDIPIREKMFEEHEKNINMFFCNNNLNVDIKTMQNEIYYEKKEKGISLKRESVYVYMTGEIVCEYQISTRLYGIFSVRKQEDKHFYPVEAENIQYGNIKDNTICLEMSSKNLLQILFWEYCINIANKVWMTNGVCKIEFCGYKKESKNNKNHFVWINYIRINEEKKLFMEFKNECNVNNKKQIKILRRKMLYEAIYSNDRADNEFFENAIFAKKINKRDIEKERKQCNWKILRGRIDNLLETTFLKNINCNNKEHLYKTVLFSQKRNYRSIYGIMRENREELSSIQFFGSDNLKVGKLENIFEYWCYIKILSIFVSKYKFEVINNTSKSIKNCIVQYLKEGKIKESKFELQHSELGMDVVLEFNKKIFFNEKYYDESKRFNYLQPDFYMEIKIKRDGAFPIQKKFCFDAKYRNYSVQGSEQWLEDLFGVALDKYITRMKEETDNEISGSFIIHSDLKTIEKFEKLEVDTKAYYGTKNMELYPLYEKMITDKENLKNLTCCVGTVAFLPGKEIYFENLLRMIMEHHMKLYREKCWFCGGEKEQLDVRIRKTGANYDKYYISCKICGERWVETHCFEAASGCKQKLGKHLFNYYAQFGDERNKNKWNVTCPRCGSAFGQDKKLIKSV